MSGQTDPRAPYFEPLQRFLFDTIGESQFVECKTILEFGIGIKGGMIDLYRLPHQTAYGVDLHDWSAKCPPWVKFIVSDGVTIPLDDDVVDLVYSHSVIEHVSNVHQSFSELNRITREGGFLYLTVSPLYFSSNGAHNRKLPPWEHLRPGSEYFMTKSPLGPNGRDGSYLNQYTIAMFLSEIGRQPWNIVRMERRRESLKPPSDISFNCDPLDVVTREFRIICRKTPAQVR